jgi:hypothetical protein
VAAPKEFTNQDNHGYSRSLLHKVSKSSGDFALVVHKYHRGSRTTPDTHPFQYHLFSPHLKNTKNHSQTSSQTFQQNRSATMVT